MDRALVDSGTSRSKWTAQAGADGLFQKEERSITEGVRAVEVWLVGVGRVGRK